MKVHCAHDRLVPISELKLNPKNRNIHPKAQIAQLAKILAYQGWRYPVKVSIQNGMVTAGHGRIEAALFNGWTEVPVSFQNYDTPEMQYADEISDNAIASWAELDLAGIHLDIPDFGPELDIDLLGIRDFKVDPSEKDASEDSVPATPAVAKTKLGDLYRLGDHRLLCMDATDPAAMERLLDGQRADMVFTDPPYGLGNKKSFNENHPNYADEVSFDLRTLPPWDSEYVIFGGNYYDWLPSPRNKIGWLVWDKRPSRESWDEETRKSADRRFGQHFEIAVTNISEIRGKMLRKTWGGYYGTAGDPINAIVHKTQKPIELLELCIQPRHQMILDLFLGSGSTLIACEKTGRRCFGTEIDPLYVDVILDRWAKYTNEDPVREDGVPWSEIKSGVAA